MDTITNLLNVRSDNHRLTLLPASLLCRFMIDLAWVRFLLPRSLASTKTLENAIPYATLSEQPDHSKPS